MQRNDFFTIDLSKLSDANYEQASYNLGKIQELLDCLAETQAQKQFNQRLLNTQKSATAAIVAEALLMSVKHRKGTLTFDDQGAQSSDLKYHQNKLGGIDIRVEIKSITTSKMGDVNKAIINAESQHKMRLVEETQDVPPCWHKTVAILAPDNPWPYSSLDDLLLAQKQTEKWKELAILRIAFLQQGCIKPHKRYQDIKLRPYRSALYLAADLQERSQRVNEKTIQLAEQRLRRSMRLAQSLNTTIECADNNVSELSEELSDSLSTDQPNSQYVSHSKAYVKQAPSLTPLSKAISMQTSRLERMVDTKSDIAEDTKLLSQLIVTERITIVYSRFDNFALVLDRIDAEKFSCHFKYLEPHKRNSVEKTHYTPRRHWDCRDVGRQKSTLFYQKKHGMTPLHKAVISSDKRAISTYCATCADMIDKDGNLALHYAVMNENPSQVMALLHHTINLNQTNNAGQSALHAAVDMRLWDMVILLLEHGADPSLQDANGTTSSQSISAVRDVIPMPIMTKLDALLKREHQQPTL